MKALIVFFMVVASCNILATTPLRVEGIGQTYIQAKEDAFRTAVEKTVGIALLSQKQHLNFNNIKNEIVTYSAGYVDNYKIVDQQFLNGQYFITVDVYVKSSKIASKLLSEGNQLSEFDGNNHNTQLDSYYNERAQLDKFIDSVLSDYPQNAYNLTIDTYQVKVDAYRNTYLIIPFTVSWNYNYLISFSEMFRLTEEGHTSWRKRAVSNVKLEAKPPQNKFLGYTKNYGYNDIVTVNNIKSKMTGDNEVRLKLTLKDRYGEIIALRCYSVIQKSTFYAVNHNNNISIYGNTTYSDFASVKLNRPVDQIDSVDLTITSAGKCKNRI
jgi:hypothetical protein